MILYQCPVCLEVLVGNECQEPCQCVFTGPSILDASGVLHTAPRISVDMNVYAIELDAFQVYGYLEYMSRKEKGYYETDEHAWEMYAQTR